MERDDCLVYTRCVPVKVGSRQLRSHAIDTKIQATKAAIACHPLLASSVA